MTHLNRSLFLLSTFVAVLGATQALAQPAPPAEWTCDVEFFGTEDGCDCGCGALDPDCTDATFAACEFDQCDDATTQSVPSQANPLTCVANTCGDGVIEDAEECDDDDADAGDGCSATCTDEDNFDCDRPDHGDTFFQGLTSVCVAVVCGDRLINGEEECDDGNVVATDGCDAACLVVDGFACGEPGTACHPIVCGDSLEDGAEDCDDGNATAGDGCDAACLLEDGFSCGDPGTACIAVPPGWTCDERFFGAVDGCDCGCGVADPDCADATIESCSIFNGCDSGEVDPADTTQCIAATEGEGEGEGGGGEGEGEDENDNDRGGIAGPTPQPAGCSTTPLATSSAAALLAVLAVLNRRRKR